MEAKRSSGERIRSGESMDLADELDLMYEEGMREGQRRGRRPRRPTAADVDRARAPRRAAPSSSSSSSSAGPGFSGAFPMPSLGAGLERQAGQTLILMFGTFAALGAVLKDVYNPASATPNAQPAVQTVAVVTASGTRTYQTVAAGGKGTTGAVKFPAHLKSVAGVFVVTTIALALNEVNPTLGVSMAGLLLLDVGLSLYGHGGSSSVIDRVGGAVFNGGTTVKPIPNAPVKPAPSQGTKV